MLKLIAVLALASTAAAVPATRPHATASATVNVAAASARAEKHPKIVGAMRALQGAKSELLGAAHDFKGHRVEAIKAIDAALVQLQLALDADK